MRCFIGAACRDRLLRDKMGMAGAAIILIFVVAAIMAPWLAPHTPQDFIKEHRLQGPSQQYPLGTDQLGRCIFSRLLHGARVSLISAFLILGVTLAISLPVGMLSGYVGGRLDQLLMRIVDTLLAFPMLILALAVAGFLGGGLIHMLLALGSVWWVSYARIIRGLTLSVKERDFVMAAKGTGTPPVSMLVRHVLPHILSTVMVMATMDIGKIIMAIAGLSFLGIGVQPPAPEWGSMLNEGRPYFQMAPHLMLFPGLALMMVVFASNLLGDSLRDALQLHHRAAD